MVSPKPGQVVWRWSGLAGCPVQITFIERRRSWCRWKYGGGEWSERSGSVWFDNAVNCAWAEFKSRVCGTGNRIKHFNANPERETERAYEAACVYVRCFCDQFKASPQQAWESPGGTPPEKADAEKHTK